MPDTTEVVNSALALVKAPLITSPSDQSANASLALLGFASTRDSVLEQHDWDFASITASLAPAASAPLVEWASQYPLPSNPWCITVRDPDPVYVPWAIGYHPTYGRVLLADVDTMTIRYTARITDLNIWSPLAVKALVYLLASEYAPRITGSTERGRHWQQAFLTTLHEAGSRNAGVGSARQVRATQVLKQVRYGRTAPE